MKKDIKTLLREASGLPISISPSTGEMPIDEKKNMKAKRKAKKKANKKLTQKPKKEKKDKKEDPASPVLYAKVQDILSDEIFDRSRVMQKADMGQADDSSDRSLFRKKLEQEDGQEFTQAELMSVFRAISDFNGELTKKVGDQDSND